MNIFTGLLSVGFLMASQVLVTGVPPLAEVAKGVQLEPTAIAVRLRPGDKERKKLDKAKSDSPVNLSSAHGLIYQLDKSAHKKQGELFDFQYNQSGHYQYVALKDLLADFFAQHAVTANLALLSFNNGMLIPVPLKDSKPVEGLDIVIAFGYKPGKTGSYGSQFPKIVKPSDINNDPRPIAFNGNKVVVAIPWHPSTGESLADSQKVAKQMWNKIFSPWRHADSLIGIDLVDDAAWYNQFPQAQKGAAVAGFQNFKNRCQYCHGVRKVGASFGWDFVEPLPIHQNRTADHLFNHVKYPYFEALEKGLMMPNQRNFTMKEAEEIWQWAKFAAEGKNLPYEP